MKSIFFAFILITFSVNLYSETVFLAIKCVNKNYIAVDDDDGKATSSTIGRSETFEVNFINPKLITIKAKTNKFLCADQTFFSKASFRFNRDNAGEWETFEIHPVNASQVYIKSHNDYYLELKDNKVNFWNKNPNENCLFNLCNLDGSLFNHNLPIPKTNNNVLLNKEGKRLYKKGEIIKLKVLENDIFSNKDLGKGYDENFQEIDKFEFQKEKDKEEKRFRFFQEKIEDNLSKNWGISMLGLGINEKSNSQERSLTISYNYFNHTESIAINQNKLSYAKIVLVGITYGWSLDYRFTGTYYSLSESKCLDVPDQFAFTNVLKKLTNSSPNKIDISNSLEKQKVKFEYKMNGFELKDTNKIPIMFEDNERFLSQFKPRNIPIYLYFQVYDDFVSDKIEWKEPIIENGLYNLSKIEFTIMKSKKDGKKWEPNSQLPDKIIVKNTKGQNIGKCDYLGGETYSFKPNLQIDTRLNQNIIFEIFDEDKGFFEDGVDDYIGRIYFNTSILIGKKFPKCEINYNYEKGQIVDKIFLEFEEK